MTCFRSICSSVPVPWASTGMTDGKATMANANTSGANFMNTCLGYCRKRAGMHGSHARASSQVGVTMPDMRGPADTELERLARRVAERLEESHRRLATAESCTGGWIAKVCTDLPGSSRWFAGGLVAYSNAAKTQGLDVDPDVVR